MLDSGTREDHNDSLDRQIGTLRDLDNEEVDLIVPSTPSDDGDDKNFVITTDNQGRQHIHDEDMCIQYGTFWFPGGRHCLNPECPSALPLTQIWEEWYDHHSG